MESLKVMQLPYKRSMLFITMVTLLALSLTGCGQPPTSASQREQSTTGTKDTANKAKQKRPPSVVNVVPAKIQSIPQYQQFSGRTVAFETATIVPEVTGIVEEILFRKGTMVQAGQPLYRINPDNYITLVASGEAAINKSKSNHANAQASLAQAQASLTGRLAMLAQAKADVKRYKALLQVNAVSVQAYEQIITAERTADANVEAAKAAVQQAIANIATAQAGIETAKANMVSNELNLGRTLIKAPITGVTNLSKVDVGSLVSIGQTQLVSITQLNPIYVDISQSSANMLKTRQEIANGQAQQGFNSVELVLEDGSVYSHRGKLSLREAQVDETTGSVTMRATFDNSQGVLLPGMFVNARVAQTIIPNAILLPQSAIMRTPKGDTQVYIVDSENKIQIRPVTINGTHENNWVVTGGLQPNDKIVVIGGSKVKPEQVVTAQPLPELPINANINNPLKKPSAILANTLNHQDSSLPTVAPAHLNKNRLETNVPVNNSAKTHVSTSINKPSVLVAVRRDTMQTEPQKAENIQNSIATTVTTTTNTASKPTIATNSVQPQVFEKNTQNNTYIKNSSENETTSSTTSSTASMEASAIEEARKEALSIADNETEESDTESTN